MRLIRHLLGTDFPAPVAGQVWRSRHSGRRMFVNDVETLDNGSVFIYVEHEYEPGRRSMADLYAIGLGQWRRRLRDEGRELLAVDHPRQRFAPPPRDLNGMKVDPAPFSTWALREGYDIAQTYDTDRSRWVFLNPMTADLWKAWQAAHGLSASSRHSTGESVPARCAPVQAFVGHAVDVVFDVEDHADEQDDQFDAATGRPFTGPAS